MNRKPKAALPLLEYVIQHYVPEKEKAGVQLTTRTRAYYRSLAMQFCEFAGEKTAPRDVTDDLLFRFESWLIDRGYDQRWCASAPKAYGRSPDIACRNGGRRCTRRQRSPGTTST